MARPETLADYLQGLDPGQREAIDGLRRRACTHLPRFRESFEFGMPYFRRGPTVSVGFAVRGKGVSIYAGEAALSALPGRLDGVDRGKDCVRFARQEQVDWALVERILLTVSATPG